MLEERGTFSPPIPVHLFKSPPQQPHKYGSPHRGPNPGRLEFGVFLSIEVVPLVRELRFMAVSFKIKPQREAGTHSKAI